jgi:RimJ/RimL family protein N-acetyltransferase
MIPIATPRLRLREITGSDFEAIHAYASDPLVCRFMLFGPNTHEDTRNFIERSITARLAVPRDEYNLLTTLGDGTVIGGCGIHGAAGDESAGFIGYLFGRDYWGRGYGTEVARALVAYGFDHLGLERMWSTCDAENTASANILEKTGMKREEASEEKNKTGTGTHTAYRYGVARANWGKTL